MVCIAQDSGVSYADALANGWLLKDSHGNLITTGTTGGQPCYFGDIGSADYQAKFANNLLRILTANPADDGIFADGVSSCTKNWTETVPTKYPTDDSFRAAYKSFWANVSAKLRGASYYIAANADASCPGDSRSNDGTLTRWWWSYLVDANGRSYLSGPDGGALDEPAGLPNRPARGYRCLE
jgi:hypothetical protein